MSTNIGDTSSHSSSTHSLTDTFVNDACNSTMQEQKVSIEVKFAINIVLNKFLTSEDIKEFEFPSSLSSSERSYIHKLCKMNDFNSSTRGKGSNKTLLVTKKDTLKPIESKPVLKVSSEAWSRLAVTQNLFQLNLKEREDLYSKIQKPPLTFNDELIKKLCRFKNFNPRVIEPGYKPVPNYLDKSPVYFYRFELINSINQNRIVYIGGEVGTGKTSFVAQALLDTKDQNSRIFFSQPFDLLAYHTAKLTARERNEKIGETIGCQIFSDVRTSEKTVLTFCSHEIMLKNLINVNDGRFLNSITHIVLDEIQLRDKFCDLLLVVIKEVLVKYKHIKLIMIGSILYPEFFQRYFNHCAIHFIPSYQKTILDFYIEDVIRLKKAEGFVDINKQDFQIDVLVLENWCVEKRRHMCNITNEIKTNNKADEDEENLIKFVDSLIEKAWIYGNNQYFKELFNLVETKKINVDYEHSQTLVTPLMAGCVSSSIKTVETLLEMGANPWKMSCNDLTPLDWAKRFSKSEAVELLECYNKKDSLKELYLGELNTEMEFIRENSQLKSDEYLALKSYYSELCQRQVSVDFSLITLVIKHILKSPDQGSILVFLPNFREINGLVSYLKTTDLNSLSTKIHVVYAEMDFDKVPIKAIDRCDIILTTGISENSLAFHNVSAVIDSGLTEEKTFDPQTNQNLTKLIWISKFCANARRNKINNLLNTGKCYRLYSKYRFKSLQFCPLPQMLSYPTQEICMLAKLTMPFNTSITDQVGKAPDSPVFLQMRNSINYLKTIDALDTWEDMTELGIHLVNMPVELGLAKMIMFAIGMKCLDPVVVIASSISVGEPFRIDFTGSEFENKIELDNFAYSDHILLYKLFKGWLSAKKTQNEKVYCQKYKIDSEFMNIIDWKRRDLLDYLRRVDLIKCRGSNELNELNKNSNKVCLIKAALIAGCYPRLVRIDKINKRLVGEKIEIRNKLDFRSVVSSGIEYECSRSYEWMIYDEMCQSGNLKILNRCTLVSSISVAIFTGQLKMNENLFKTTESLFDENSESSKSRFNETDYSDEVNFKIDNWINFKTDRKTGKVLFALRQKLNSLIINCTRQHSISNNMCQEYDKFLQLLSEVLQFEELKQDDLNFEYESIDFNVKLDITRSWDKNDKNSMSKYFIAETDLLESDLIRSQSKSDLVCRVSWNLKTLNDFLLDNGRVFLVCLNIKERVFSGVCELIKTKDAMKFSIKIIKIRLNRVPVEEDTEFDKFYDGKEIDQLKYSKIFGKIIQN